MKKLLTIISVMFLVGTMNVQAQQRKLNAYAVGFYNLENLFDTQHDEGHNDYEYLPDGRNKWTEMKYTHKLRNMARVLAEMGIDRQGGTTRSPLQTVATPQRRHRKQTRPKIRHLQRSRCHPKTYRRHQKS